MFLIQELILICLNSFSTICFSSTNLKLERMSDDLSKASLTPSDPAYDASIV